MEDNHMKACQYKTNYVKGQKVPIRTACLDTIISATITMKCKVQLYCMFSALIDAPVDYTDHNKLSMPSSHLLYEASHAIQYRKVLH